MKKFIKFISIINIVLSPIYLITNSYKMFFINIFIGALGLYYLKKGVYDKPLFKKEEIPPILPTLPKRQYEYKYIEVTRNNNRVKYIGYLFSNHKFVKREKEDYDKEVWVGNNVYKYEFDEIPCTLLDNGNYYDVCVETPICKEIVGTIPKARLHDGNYDIGFASLLTEGGSGWKIYEDEEKDYKIKFSELQRFPYEMVVEVEIRNKDF